MYFSTAGLGHRRQFCGLLMLIECCKLNCAGISLLLSIPLHSTVRISLLDHKYGTIGLEVDGLVALQRIALIKFVRFSFFFAMI